MSNEPSAFIRQEQEKARVEALRELDAVSNPPAPADDDQERFERQMAGMPRPYGPTGT